MTDARERAEAAAREWLDGLTIVERKDLRRWPWMAYAAGAAESAARIAELEAALRDIAELTGGHVARAEHAERIARAALAGEPPTTEEHDG